MIYPPGIWRLEVLFGGTIEISNGKIVHHIHDSQSLGPLIDYIRADPNFDNRTYVWGFIEDRRLIIERRIIGPTW